jgi:hypothetical protein
MRNLVRRAGFDVVRWPRRPDDVLNWALDAVLRTRDINCVIDVTKGLSSIHCSVRCPAWSTRSR